MRLDPPYRSRLGAITVSEIEAAEEFAAPADFERIDARRYGKARLVFLRLIGETLAGT